MITVLELASKADFDWWLAGMDEALENLALLPKEIRSQMNYSTESLVVLESYLCQNYSYPEIESPENKYALDLFSRYVGETFRKNLKDIIWTFADNPDSSDYLKPVLTKNFGLPFGYRNPVSFVVSKIYDNATGGKRQSLMQLLVNNINAEPKRYEDYKKQGLI